MDAEREGRLRAVLLELGLEDWIPVPEAVALPEVRAIVASEEVAAAVAQALVDLFAKGQIAMYRGPWNDDDPEPVPREETVRLLSDPAWFGFRIDDPNEERLYFVNVENIRS
jgi:hypothetical protein